MEEKSENTQIPENWTWAELKELTENSKNGIVDGPFGSNLKSEEYIETGVPVFKIQNIKENRFVDKNINFVSPTKAEELSRHSFQKGDLIITKLGNPLGLCCKVPEKYPYGIIVADLIRFRPSSQRVVTQYLMYGINSAVVQNQFKAITKGTTRPRVNLTIVREIKFPLPPIPEQRAIVSKIEQLFSELDNGIANLKLAQEQLKVYRQAVLKKAFEGELTKKWREKQTDLPDAGDLLEQVQKERTEIIKTSGGKVKNMESLTDMELADLPEVPDRWRWVKLQELCNLIGGVTKGRKFEGKKTISLPYLRVANVQDGYLNLSEIKYIDVLEGDLEKYRLIAGDILYTEGGDKDKLGRGTIWKGQIENCIHQNHIFRARPYSSNLLSSYIGYFSQTQTAKNYFFRNAKQTVNLASINLTVLSNLSFPLCSFPEQQAIVQEIETRLSVCDKIEQDIKDNLERAEALRQSILKKAFEGKLLNEKELAEVRGAEDWEPAEVLLERIKAEKAGNGKKGQQPTEKMKSIIQEDKGLIQQATLQAFEQIDK